ncbi:DNA-sulfur modification-associated [Geodermatophilus dictyosporus]|uniref:DNA-sulfur modification-associated n=1 Tax=Geodermatophilus dictyosporus TaxID=1523247 RepID=A0A1I5RSM2_9ACTN|nr:DNA sulfur modification protein DndB [Geodermatophilus dictyosporus]SFP61512.1 DNA-sulfur modification-associated [Geodermatophilus dictyosporus]
MPKTDPLSAFDLDAIAEAEKQKTQIVQAILQDKLRGQSRFLVQRLEMGRAASYIGGVSFRWIAQNLLLFTQLPLFKKYVDKKSGKFKIDEESVQDLQQRAPNWLRQTMMTLYLFRQPRRKFPPMLVVVQEHWVDNLEAPEWDEEGRARRTSMPLDFLTPDGSVAVLDLAKGVTCYVIDGSHRYLGIKGLEELTMTGMLVEKKADGTEGKKVRKKDDLMELYRIDDADIAGIMDESMGVEFIPAVLEGETREDARIRVRSVFVHVNKTAQPPTKGEISILDEDNGFALVAKRLAFNHKLFRKDHPGDRINWKTNALPAGSHWITSSVTLIAMVEDYLKPTGSYASWVPDSPKEVPLRPMEHEINDAVLEMNDLLDHISQLPAFKAIASGTKIDSLRDFPPNGDGHLLLRPIGQQILAAALGHMHNHPNGPQETLNKLFTRLDNYDRAGGFGNVSSPISPWYGVTYDPYRGTMATDRKHTAVLLLRHLLHDALTVEVRNELLDDLRMARHTLVNDKELVYDWNGKAIEPDQLSLPAQI